MNVSETLSLSNKAPLTKAGILEKINIAQMSVNEVNFQGAAYYLPILSGETIAYSDGQYVKAFKTSSIYNLDQVAIDPVQWTVKVGDSISHENKLKNVIAMYLYTPLVRLRDVLVNEFGVESSIAIIQFVEQCTDFDFNSFHTTFTFLIGGYGAIS